MKGEPGVEGMAEKRLNAVITWLIFAAVLLGGGLLLAWTVPGLMAASV